MVALLSASWAAGRSGVGSRAPRRISPSHTKPCQKMDASPGWWDQGARDSWRRACGLGLVSQLTSHICPLLMESILSADELGHGKLDIKLGALLEAAFLYLGSLS